MLQVQDTLEARKINCRAEIWTDRLPELREWAKAGRLVCCKCKEHTWFRSGSIRKPYFAHRDKSECPLNQQSAAVLEAKACIYNWMNGIISKGEGILTEVLMEEPVPGREGLIADVIATTPKGIVFSYWFFDRAQRNRDMWLGLASNVFYPHFIHLKTTCKEPTAGILDLTASQRHFMSKPSIYDLCIAGNSMGHLTFLDPEPENIRICRELHLRHRPAKFSMGSMRACNLSDALLCPDTGEIITAQDQLELLEHQRRESERLQREEAELRRRLAEQEDQDKREPYPNRTNEEHRGREAERRQREETQILRRTTTAHEQYTRKQAPYRIDEARRQLEVEERLRQELEMVERKRGSFTSFGRYQQTGMAREPDRSHMRGYGNRLSCRVCRKPINDSGELHASSETDQGLCSSCHNEVQRRMQG